MSDDLVSFLRSTPLLRELPEPVLRSIAGSMRPLEVSEGTLLFEEGAPGHTAYLILEGELALTSQGVELLRRGPGGIVGEFSLIDERPRSTSGVARSGLRVLAETLRDFHRWRQLAAGKRAKPQLSVSPYVSQGGGGLTLQLRF